ncbi:MAG: hypothetical protein PHD32_01565 [Eubacteriales bacterium]|nr:hypothetical protein [Eubacteriales bacterium]
MKQKWKTAAAVVLIGAALTGCTAKAQDKTQRAVAQTPTPTATPVPFAQSWLTQTGEVQADLNGDGTQETIAFRRTDSESYEETKAEVIISGSEGLLAQASLPGTFDSAAVVDFDSGDGVLEILLCVDAASDDFQTVAYRFDGTQLLASNQLFGKAERVQDGKLLVSNWVNVLGTWAGRMRYVLKDGFNFTQEEGALWECTKGYFEPIVLKKELVAEVLNNCQYEPITLPAGTQLTMVATDGSSEVYMTTGDGQACRFAISTGEYNQTMIEGAPAEDWFGELLYAG